MDPPLAHRCWCCIKMFYCLLTALDYDNDSDPPLAHKAAAAGDVPLLVQAIKHDPGVIQQRDSEGMYFTHLHAILHNGIMAVLFRRDFYTV